MTGLSNVTRSFLPFPSRTVNDKLVKSRSCILSRKHSLILNPDP